METKKEDIWEKIEREKRTDTWMKRICIGSWASTLLLIILFVIVVIQQTLKHYAFWGMPDANIEYLLMKIAAITIPFLAIGAFTFGASILSTIGLFIRMRTSSLRDIQLRLGTLENAILATKDE